MKEITLKHVFGVSNISLLCDGRFRRVVKCLVLYYSDSLPRRLHAVSSLILISNQFSDLLLFLRLLAFGFTSRYKTDLGFNVRNDADGNAAITHVLDVKY